MNSPLAAWYQLPISVSEEEQVIPISINNLKLLGVRRNNSVRVFEPYCPHRGANLAIGGILRGQHIYCPFHGMKVRLGYQKDHPSLKEYTVCSFRGLYFVSLSTNKMNALPEALNELSKTHRIYGQFTTEVRARHDLIIENGFDQRHFKSTHRVVAQNFSVAQLGHETLRIEGLLSLGVKLSPLVKLMITAFGPGLSIVEATGTRPYVMIVGATPLSAHSTSLNVAVVLNHTMYGAEGRHPAGDAFLSGARRAIEEDRPIWENLKSACMPDLSAAEDATVRAFHAYKSLFPTVGADDA